MIRMDGTKMSKSKGNLIAPASYYESVGADALRLFHLFVGPPADDFDWTEQTDQVVEGNASVPRPLVAPGVGRLSPTSAAGASRLGKATSTGPTSRLAAPSTGRSPRSPGISSDDGAHGGRRLHGAGQRPLRLRRGVNRPSRDVLEEALEGLLRLMAPMTPAVTAELWEMRHPDRQPLHSRSWPSFDPDLVRSETVTMVVQVNGKSRDRLEVDGGTGEEAYVSWHSPLPRSWPSSAGASRGE